MRETAEQATYLWRVAAPGDAGAPLTAGGGFRFSVPSRAPHIRSLAALVVRRLRSWSGGADHRRRFRIIQKDCRLSGAVGRRRPDCGAAGTDVLALANRVNYAIVVEPFDLIV